MECLGFGEFNPPKVDEVDLYVVDDEENDEELFIIEEPNGVASTLWLLADVAS